MSDDPKRTIAARAALELHAGEVVNLGIGIPNMIPAFLDDDSGVFLHTENGLLGVGPRPDENELDSDMIDAAKRPVTALPGASYFDSAASFAMIRGGHIDVAVLGALQVSASGDIANWAVPGKDVLGVGGAMDLVVDAVITELSVFRIRDGALVLTELLDGATEQDVRAVTSAEFAVDLIRGQTS